MPGLPAPADLEALPRELLGELRTHRDEREVVAACCDLLSGGAPEDHADLLPYLAGRPGAAYFEQGWADYWPRVWGARALLYVWDDDAAPVVAAGLGDPAWRVAELCLKVSARHELPVGDAAASLAGHALARVREAAVRALGACGDVEHVAVVASALDDEDEAVRRSADRALDRMCARLDVPRP
jgi:HEAT repeat protein